MSFPETYPHKTNITFIETGLEPVPEEKTKDLVERIKIDLFKNEAKEIPYKKFEAIYYPVPERYSQIKKLIDKWLSKPNSHNTI